MICVASNAFPFGFVRTLMIGHIIDRINETLHARESHSKCSAESFTLEARRAQANCPAGLRIKLPPVRDYNLEQFGVGIRRFD
jgi:hypothetical protein